MNVTPPTGGRILGPGISCGAGATACSVTMPAGITLAAPVGAAAGALIGLAAGLFALLPQAHLGTSAITMFVGSGLVVSVALIHRRING